ncbi:transporter [Trinickia dinghuensis]|uniref:Transporter n=1 Tax=Trinickia dinghuensis TaxID=2291023 RepID=A0A3D8JQ33_9BURK|nr:transporter [Trinickia dinghuensis]RDU94912.1 hypothetical protein DWV00_31710 [Trinickia dinghuensis]
MSIFSKRHAPLRAALGVCASLAVCSPAAVAHAVVGDRLFPATLTVDDPGVGDEFDFQFGHIKSPTDDGDSMNVNTASYEWDKLITSNLAFSVASQYVDQNVPNGGSARGWADTTIGVKYLAYTNATHEFMASVGFLAALGGTGAKSVANPYSTFTPNVYFGKGFGDLPASLGYLRPFAITGQVGPNITTATSDTGPNSLGWGLTLQYSIPYLQSEVRDLHLPEPLSNLIPIVEFPMSTATAGASAGQTTGTINPGVLWTNRYGQFGIEAQIPVNRASGTHVGVLLDAHLYFDDLFPGSLGKPLF